LLLLNNTNFALLFLLLMLQEQPSVDAAVGDNNQPVTSKGAPGDVPKVSGLVVF